MSFDINNFKSNCIGNSGDIIFITTQDFNKSNYLKSDVETVSNTGTVELIFNTNQNLTINKNDIIYNSNGNLGNLGNLGNQGFQGFKGTQGLIGSQGFMGNPGVQGFQGIKGYQGLIGIQGIIGQQGIVGVQGNTGFQGSPLIISRTINSFKDIYSLYLPNIYECVHVNGGQLYMFMGNNNGITGPNNAYSFISDIIDENNLSINGSQGTQGFQGITGTQGVIGPQGITSTPIISITGLTGNIMLRNITGAAANSILYFQNENIYSVSLSGTFVNIQPTNKYFGVLKDTPAYTLDIAGNARKSTTTTWLTGSDERVKENIEDADLDICYNIVKTLKLRRFKWKEENYPEFNDRNVIGFIAQEIEQYFPNSIRQNNEHGFIDFKSIDVDQVYKTMYGALQKLISELEILEQELGIE
jgi:hypothetical protein